MRDIPNTRNLELLILTTGGTIDGADSDQDTIRSESAATGWLNRQKEIQATSLALFNKDSRQITENDREQMVRAIFGYPGKLLLITHGTFTIAETGRYLKQRLGDTDKTILLVGSWLPFGSELSDAASQMEFALGVLRAGAPGIWIAMDGRLWDPAVTEKQEVAPGEFRLVEVRR